MSLVGSAVLCCPTSPMKLMRCFNCILMTTLALFSQLAGADLPSAVTSLGCSGCPDSQLEVSSKLDAEGLLWPRGELASLTDAQCLGPQSYHLEDIAPAPLCSPCLT